MHLEHLFGHAARSTGDGVIPILERGPAICAIYDLLKEYCAETRCKFCLTILKKELVIDQYVIEKETTAPTSKKERYRPAVKFRKFDKALLEKLQTGVSNLDNDVLVQERTSEIQDDDSEGEELIGEETLQDGGAGLGGLKVVFAIDSQIDINSRALLDMISDEATVINQPTPSARTKMGGEMSIDEAFEDWQTTILFKYLFITLSNIAQCY